jgi:acyl-CoA thioester hydrolase
MFKASTTLRVRYGETDQMGYVYYGNYALYYEVGRVEALRTLGLTYKGMEESGVLMPVLELKSKFIKPAFYDDMLTVHTYIKELPITRLHFEYEIYNQALDLINAGETTLVFIDRISNRPCRAPDDFYHRLSAHFTAPAQ